MEKDVLKLPKAKTDNIVTQESGKDLLLYNLTTNQAYCLNETAAVIYQFCDGKNSTAELKLQTKFGPFLV